jgi:hypothetical protein
LNIPRYERYYKDTDYWFWPYGLSSLRDLLREPGGWGYFTPFSRAFAAFALGAGVRFQCFAGQLIEHNPLADDALHSSIESFRIGHFAIVISIRLLVEVAEQVKWFDAYVRAVDAAFQQRPEIFQTIRVDFPVHVCHGVVDHLMLELIQSLV